VGRLGIWSGDVDPSGEHLQTKDSRLAAIADGGRASHPGGVALGTSRT
jgi:hypothetical protein